MDRSLNPQDVHRLAAIELNLFNLAHTDPGLRLEGAHINPGTPVYDPTGEVLFYRMLLHQNNGVRVGYADLAAHTLFGSPLLATAPDVAWDPDAWIAQARAALHRRTSYDRKSVTYDEVRFVAFSFPKLAVQFLSEGKEVAMLELGTWAPVPVSDRGNRKPMEPGSFERFSLIEELPDAAKRDAHNRFSERVSLLDRLDISPAARSVISKSGFDPSIGVLKLHDTEELHYTTRPADHHICYELRGQETNVWCVAASVQMVLDFYRYEYTQSRIAQQLNLGTLANPTGLPYANDNDVTVALQAMSSNALTSTMLTTPPFSNYTAEIRANRPVISFIPGHSRSVAGYTQSLFMFLGGTGFRGLLVYDPWPPNAGVVTRWENFDTQTYRRAFTAHVTTI